MAQVCVSNLYVRYSLSGFRRTDIMATVRYSEHDSAFLFTEYHFRHSVSCTYLQGGRTDTNTMGATLFRIEVDFYVREYGFYG